MSKIRFIVDYRGALTGEQYFTAGTEMSHASAAALVADGRAEFVEIEPTDDLDGLSVKQLKQRAQNAGVKGYGRMKRAALVDALKDG